MDGNGFAMRDIMEAVLDVSVITCPACGFAREEVMPATSCAIMYRCTKCGASLWPAEGDCCVYCTYGSVPCQAVQIERARKAAAGEAPWQERPDGAEADTGAR